MNYRLEIFRFNPETDGTPSWRPYTVEAEPDERVLDALVRIQRYQDGSLTFRKSCAHGVCGSDAMVINGKSRLACQFLLADASREHDPITVEPLPGFPLIKDLLVDMELFFARYREMSPWLVEEKDRASVPGDGAQRERRQSPAEWERFEYTSNCILCGICTSSCPTFWADKEYVGPAAIVQSHRFIFDSRDSAVAERIKRAGAPGGAFSCRSIYNCSAACPRHIEIVRAINEVRMAVLRKGRGKRAAGKASTAGKPWSREEG